MKNTNDQGNHIRLIEIDGSTGDLEGEIFLESFRQFQSQYKGKILHIHLSYVPFLRCSQEFKTKPLQLSIRELLRSGLQLDVIVARYSPEENQHLSLEILNKISLFGSLPLKNIVALPDLESIYAVSKYLCQTTLVSTVQDFVGRPLKLDLPKFLPLKEN